MDGVIVSRYKLKVFLDMKISLSRYGDRLTWHVSMSPSHSYCSLDLFNVSLDIVKLYLDIVSGSLDTI
jgi:hypothetical protein